MKNLKRKPDECIREYTKKQHSAVLSSQIIFFYVGCNLLTIVIEMLGPSLHGNDVKAITPCRSAIYVQCLT